MTDYVKALLMRDERITMTVRRHPVILLPGLFFVVLFALKWFGILSMRREHGETLVIGVGAMLVAALSLWRCELTITTDRIVGRRGIGFTAVDHMFADVEGIDCDQGWLGRFFDWGTITIHSKMDGDVTIWGVRNPLDFADTYTAVKRQARTAGRYNSPGW